MAHNVGNNRYAFEDVRLTSYCTDEVKRTSREVEIAGIIV
jgi:hypothetical protein